MAVVLVDLLQPASGSQLRARVQLSHNGLDRLAACGMPAAALFTIDAIVCNPDIAKIIVDHDVHSLLAVKTNQPSLPAEIERQLVFRP